MVLSSSFERTQVIQLPLPEPKEGQNYDEIKADGLKVGLSLLHNDKVMIDFDNDSISHESIEPMHQKAVDVFKLASQFGTPLRASDDPKSSSSEWRHFQVTENIPVLGMSKKITFTTALRYNADGMEALSDAGSGVTIYGKYVISQSEDDRRCLQLAEVTKTQCSALLNWYIKSTMTKAHSRVNAFYKEQFVEAMKRDH